MAADGLRAALNSLPRPTLNFRTRAASVPVTGMTGLTAKRYLAVATLAEGI